VLLGHGIQIRAIEHAVVYRKGILEFLQRGGCLIGHHVVNQAGGIEIEALPLPKYTAESSYLAPCYHNNYIITVPKTAERKELIGKVLQLIGEKTKDFNTYSIRDVSVNYVDRDTYTEMFEDYVAPGFSADLFTIMINAGEPIALGTMRAIGMPIIT